MPKVCVLVIGHHGSVMFVHHFPFYAFNDEEFLVSLSDSVVTKHRFTVNYSVLFNPFELNRDENVCHDRDFGPDDNFFSVANVSYS